MAPDPVRDFAREEADARNASQPSGEDDANYLVITCSEDGDVSAELLNRKTLLARLNEKYWGNQSLLRIFQGDHVDLRAKSGIYIIKGEFVIPHPKSYVTEWDVK